LKAAVMGAGSWGTTFAQVLCDAGTPAVLYARRPETAKAIAQDRENPAYLPGISLTPALTAGTDHRGCGGGNQRQAAGQGGRHGASVTFSQTGMVRSLSLGHSA
jgi:predicted dinucleotide-binding enzyme